MSRWDWTKNVLAVLGILLVITLSVVIWHPETSLDLTLLIVFGGVALLAAVAFLSALFAAPHTLVFTGVFTRRYTPLAAGYDSDLPAWARKSHAWLTLAVASAASISLTAALWVSVPDLGTKEPLMRWGIAAVVATGAFAVSGFIACNLLLLAFAMLSRRD